MSASGTLSITCRGGGKRWYGRIAIPAEIAAVAGIKAGDSVSFAVVSGRLVLSADTKGKISFPVAAGRQDCRHVFEAATASLRLRDVRHPPSDVQMHAVFGGIAIGVPSELLLDATKETRQTSTPHAMAVSPDGLPRMRAEELVPRAPPEQAPDEWNEEPDPVAAVMSAGGRSGRRLSPVRIGDLVEFLRCEGTEVEILNRRLFRVDGETLTGAGLADLANKICANRNQAQFVLMAE